MDGLKEFINVSFANRPGEYPSVMMLKYHDVDDGHMTMTIRTVGMIMMATRMLW